GPDALHPVALSTDIVPDAPGSRLPFEAAISEVHALLDRAPVRLTARLQFAPRRLAVEFLVLDLASHGQLPFLSARAVTVLMSNSCPIYVQTQGSTREHK